MIVFDTETTDLTLPTAADLKDQPHIIEFAAIKLCDQTLEEIERIEFLCHPGCMITEEITKITGITNEMLEGKPLFSEYYYELCGFFLGESRLVAHNLEFDKSMLKFELMRIDKLLAFPWPFNQRCTVEASYHLHNKRLNLTNLHKEATGKEFAGAHRAIVDVEALCTCVRWMSAAGML